MITVTGPSFTRDTCISVRKRPVATVAPRARNRSTTASTSGSACSGRAALIQLGPPAAGRVAVQRELTDHEHLAASCRRRSGSSPRRRRPSPAGARSARPACAPMPRCRRGSPRRARTARRRSPRPDRHSPSRSPNAPAAPPPASPESAAPSHRPRVGAQRAGGRETCNPPAGSRPPAPHAPTPRDARRGRRGGPLPTGSLTRHADPGFVRRCAVAHRLPHLPGQAARRRSGRLHPAPHQGARRPRAHRRGLRRPALPGARRAHRAAQAAQPRPVERALPRALPGVLGAEVQGRRRSRRSAI